MLIWVLFALSIICSARRPLQDPSSWTQTKSYRSNRYNNNNGYTWSEEWLDSVPVDHFSFANTDTFPLRFFINTESYKPGGPILFYTGNEGNLEGFATNTGFMWDLAPELNAAVIFAEHRFYGKTQPYRNASYTNTRNLGFLSSEQALADFVLLIDYLRTARLNDAANASVIAFGGSYGGMLSAWLRIKYPHKVQGAIAASAPVFWFLDSHVKEDVYAEIVTRAFVDSGCKAKAITRGWYSLKALAQTNDGRRYLNNLFKLERKSWLNTPEDHQFLAAYIREVFESMAMVNYPYPTSFLSSLPGWPVKKACKFFADVPTSDEEAVTQLYNVVNLYYNYTGTVTSLCANAAKCAGAFAALGDPLGWPWQTCTEMVMPLCASGPPNDFFWKDCPYSVEGYYSYCNDTFGSIGFDRSMLRPHWATQNYGTDFPTATNIIFSNGYLDPWSGGGWSAKSKVEGSLVSIILKEGAHHYDLRGAHPDDTEEVKKVRETEKMYIKKWMKSSVGKRPQYYIRRH
ncbi:unnamed protein product, partial [Auanema sp. JU1783]